MIHCFISFLFSSFFFFFLKNTLRDMSCSAIFLMKTLLTLKYPVFIIVTNSNSKVHPFTERTDGKALVQESCGKCNTWNRGKKPACRSVSSLLQLCGCVKSVSCFLFPLKHLQKTEKLHMGVLWGDVLKDRTGSTRH